VARLRMEERAQLSDIKNLYVYSSQTNNRVPLLSIATVGNSLETGRVVRREHFRTISILCYPEPGVLASGVLNPILPKLQELQKNLPAGYQLRIGGERAKQIDGFTNLKIVLLISLVGIYLALLVQFNNAVKPLLVFAAAPYRVIGSLIALAIMHTPFGFMAFLGIASLIGVIVSHVIVLFDFIEEMHAKGEPLEGTSGRRNPADSTRDDHRGSDDPRAFPTSVRRRPSVAASVLRADRRPCRRNIYHAAPGAGPLQHLRA
jgi:multidrug efflux pump subunit AcrB